MIVALTSDGAFRLDESEDFRKFKVVVEAGRDTFPGLRNRFGGTVDFDDADTAWVAIAALRGWTHDPAWRQGLAAMIAKAAPHGWIDETGGRVRAHVEWQG